MQSTNEKAAKTDAVIKKVLGTTELLEAILLRVDDYQTLLFSQRVCRAFKDTIEESNPLQHALFFKLSDAHPAIPPILLNRKIRIGNDGSNFWLSYEPVICLRRRCGGVRVVSNHQRVTSATLDESSAGRPRPQRSDTIITTSSIELERRRAVQLRLEVSRFPRGEPGSVEIGGTWQKIKLQNAQAKVSCLRGVGYGPLSFSVPLSGEDTMGSVVDMALHFKLEDSGSGDSMDSDME